MGAGTASRAGWNKLGDRAVQALALCLFLVVSSAGPASVVAQSGAGEDARGDDGARLTLYAVGPQDQPVSRALVTVEDGDRTVANGTTDPFGSYTTVVEPDDYTIHVRAGGYEEETRRVGLDDDDVMVFQLGRATDATFQTVGFAVETRDLKTGCPIDAEYSLTNDRDIGFHRSGRTGPDGADGTGVPLRVEPDGTVASTQYDFTVDKQGYTRLPAAGTVWGSIDNHTLADVKLDPTEGALNLSVTAEVGGDTVPAENAIVSVVGRCSGGIAVAVPQRIERTGADGNASFQALPPAEYTVTIRKVGYDPVTTTVTLGADETASVDPHLELSDPSSVAVSVTEGLEFPNGQTRETGLAGANVTLHHVREGYELTRTTGEPASVSFDGLPPGPYLVEVDKDGEERLGAEVGWEDGREALYLAPGRQATLDTQLLRNSTRIDTRVETREMETPTKVLSGEDGSRWSPAAVTSQGPARDTSLDLVHRETGTTVEVTTDEDGSLSAVLPTGSYQLAPWTDQRPAEQRVGENETLDNVTIRPHVATPGEPPDEEDPSRSRLQLDDGEAWSRNPGIVLVPELGTAMVLVLHSGQEPLPKATVTLTDAEGSTFRTETDLHGVATFPRANPGPARVEVSKDGYETTTSTVEVDRWSEGKSLAQMGQGDFTVTRHTQTTEDLGNAVLKIDVQDWNEREGRYTSSIHSTWVHLVRGDRSQWDWWTFKLEFPYPWELTKFPPGQYQIVAQRGSCQEDARAAKAKTVTLGRSGTTGITFRFGGSQGGSTAAATGIPVDFVFVNDATGEPIEGAAANVEYLRDIPCGETTTETLEVERTDASGEPTQDLSMQPATVDRVQGATLTNLDALEQPYEAFVDERGSKVVQSRAEIWELRFEPNSAIVRGDVVSAATGEPLEAARVSIGPLEERTAGEGRYTIQGVPEGTFDVTVSKAGYYSAIRTMDVSLAGGGDQQMVPRSGPDVQLEPLPEPEIDVQTPLQGFFFQRPSMEFPWEITIEEWPVDTDRPGGDDAIEQVEWFADVGDERVHVDTTHHRITPDEVREEGGVAVQATVDPATLVDDLSPGEVRDVSEFYVEVTTKKQGEVRYPPEPGPRESRAIPAHVGAMPEWLAETRQAAQLSQARTNPEITETLTASIGSYLPALFRAEQVGFEARQNEASAEYEVGYDLSMGASVPMAETLDRWGLGWLGTPSVNLEETVTGRLDGARNQWSSEGGQAGGVTIPDVLPVVGVTELKGGYEQETRGPLPDQDVAFEATTDFHGSLAVEPTALASLFKKSGGTAGGSSGQEASSENESLTSFGAGVPLELTWNFTSQHSGDGPPFLESETPVVLTDGDGYVTGNQLNVNASQVISGEASLGESTVVKGKIDGVTALAWYRNAQQLGSSVGSALVTGSGEIGSTQTEDWLRGFVPTGFNASFEDFSTRKLVPFPGQEDPRWCPVGFTSVEGEMFSKRVLKLDLYGVGEVLDTEEVAAEFPFGPLDLCSGTPSQVTFVEFPTRSARLDRDWTGDPGYGDAADWTGAGALLPAAWPYAQPALAAKEGTVNLLVDHDNGGDAYPGSLSIRSYVGTDTGLRETETLNVPGGVAPAIEAQGNVTATAYSRFDADADSPASFHTAEVYAAETGVDSPQPVQLTDDERFDHGADVAPTKDGIHVAWASDPAPFKPLTTKELRYARVDQGTVQDRAPLSDQALGTPAIASTGSGPVVAYMAAPAPEPGVSDHQPEAWYTFLQGGQAQATGTFGAGVAVDVAPVDPNRTMAVVGGADGIRYAIIEDGAITEEGTVTETPVTELELAKAPGPGVLLLWPGQGALRYSAYNGTWAPPPSILEGHRSNLAASVDASTSTLFVASRNADTPSFLAEDESVSLDLDAFEIPPELFGNATEGSSTGGDLLESVTVNVSNAQAAVDKLPPAVRDRLAGKAANVRVERAGGEPLVLGLRLVGEQVQEVGPAREDPDVVVETDAGTVRAIRDSLSPKEAFLQAFESGAIEFGGDGAARSLPTEVGERAGRAFAGARDNPLDVAPGETRQVELGGEERTLGGTELGYSVVVEAPPDEAETPQPDPEAEPVEDDEAPPADGDESEDPGEEGPDEPAPDERDAAAPEEDGPPVDDDEAEDEGPDEEPTDDGDAEAEEETGGGQPPAWYEDTGAPDREEAADGDRTGPEATDPAEETDEEARAPKPSIEVADPLAVLDPRGVPKGYTTPGAQRLAHADTEGLSPSAGVYEASDDLLLGAGSEAPEQGPPSLPARTEVEGLQADDPPTVRELPGHDVVVRTFTEPSQVPCGEEASGPRVLETVTGDGGGVLLEGRTLDGARVLALRQVSGDTQRLIGACLPGGGGIDVDYVVEGDRVVEASFQQTLEEPGALGEAVRFAWDAEAGTVAFERGSPGGFWTVDTRPAPDSLESLLDWAEGIR